MIILGGLGSIWGVVLGAIALSFINNWLIPDVINDVPGKLGLDFDATQITFAIYGFLLVMMMILRPQGLLPERRHKMELAEHAETIGRNPLHGTGMSATQTSNAARRRSPTGRSVLDAVNITKQFGGLTAVNDVTFTPAGEVDRLDHRPQRRGQDDVLQHADGLLPADARARSRSTGATSPAPVRTSS